MRIAMTCSIVLTIILGVAAQGAASQIKVVVHKSFPKAELTKSKIQNAFLKKQSRFNASKVRPVDNVGDTALRAAFIQHVLAMSVSQYERYWIQKQFRDGDQPPRKVHSDAAVVRYVATFPGAIGFIAGTTDADSVKVIATFEYK